MTDFATAAIDARLAARGLALPAPPAVRGAYSAVVVRGGHGAVSGQFPLAGGVLAGRGRVGGELDLAQGRQAAELAALNVLAQIRAHFAGFAGFAGLLRVDGHVASAPGFAGQPQVLDAASALFLDVLGADLGGHARTAFAPAQLPLDAAVELCVTFAVAAGCGCS